MSTPTANTCGVCDIKLHIDRPLCAKHWAPTSAVNKVAFYAARGAYRGDTTNGGRVASLAEATAVIVNEAQKLATA